MAFERDLGYLDKFFDNLESHAATLDASAKERLLELVAEERVRWVEIRSLLGAPQASGSGKQTAPSAKASTKAAANEDTKAAPVAAPAPTAAPSRGTTQSGDVTAAATRNPATGFTVGSLRGR